MSNASLSNHLSFAVLVEAVAKVIMIIILLLASLLSRIFLPAVESPSWSRLPSDYVPVA